MAFFSKFFDKKSSSVLGIDIGSSAIKVVQISKKNGQAILETYGELALGPYAGLNVGQAVAIPPDKIAKALVNLMKEKEVSVTTNKCGVSIPFASSLMSVIEMPEVTQKQLSIMVPLEARKYVPVPISEVMLDWSIVPKSDVQVEDNQDLSNTEERVSQVGDKPPVNKTYNHIDVMIVAIHKGTIAQYQSIVSSSNLEASFFEIEIFSTMRAVLDNTLRPIMVIDVGAASTKLYVVERGIIRSSHTINRGSQDITANISRSLGVSADKAEIMKRQFGVAGEDKNLNDIITLTLDYIFGEVNNALLIFEKKYNKTISKVMLVGGGSALKGFRELAKDNFKAEVVMANPFGKLLTPAFLDNVLKETGPEFAVAIGLALRRLTEEE